MFQKGEKVIVNGMTGTIMGRAPKYWWPNLDDCYRVQIDGHGTFTIRETDLTAVI